MNIYIIRHGETKWNRIQKLQGWLNSDLTEKGIKSAERLRDRFIEEGIEFDKIYSSTQKRAIHTADIIKNGKDIKHYKMDELRELGYGVWEGMLLSDIYKEYEKEFNIYLNETHKYEPVGDGETFSELFKRVNKALDFIISNGGDNVLVVTHGVTIKAMIGIIKNIRLENFYEIPIHEGTALNICKLENGKLNFILEGDTSHI